MRDETRAINLRADYGKISARQRADAEATA
jgi:hypothetical protein